MGGSVGLGWPLFVITVFSLGMILLGYLAKIRKRTATEYFVAERSIGVIATFFGSYLTLQSAFIFMGMGALGYLMGAPAYIIALCGSAHSIIIMFVWPRIWALGKEHGWITQADYLVERYESPVFMRVVPPILAIVSIGVGHLMIQIVAMGYLFQVATGMQLPYWFGVFFMAAVFVIYVVIGGFKATAWTDIAMGLWATGSIIAAIVIFFSGLDMGVGEAFGQIATKFPKLISPPGGTGYFTWAMIVSWLFIYCFTSQSFPHQFTRAYATANKRIFPVVAAAWIPANIIFTLPVLFLGLAARNVWPTLQAAQVKPDQIICKAVMTFSNPWLAPVLLTGAVAAAMSTAAGAGITMSGMISKDLLKGCIKKDATDYWTFRAGQILVVLIGFGSACIALYQSQLITAILTAAYSIVAPLFFPLMAGLFWRRMNKYGAIAGIVCGEIVAVWQVFIQGYGDKAAWLGFQACFWAIIVSSVVSTLVSYLTPPPSAAVQEKFFAKLKYLEE